MKDQLVEALKALGLDRPPLLHAFHVGDNAVIIETPCHSVEFLFHPNGEFKGVFIS